ncbi:response regulator transcription factor [Telluribacter sp. SYSU D00476]|uniref:response regulator transcription factor n=1 Tax=Telluribacter sp. SYSU D00476 TaxID=2811430 RepID=UPI001FF2915D|nr:response regulator transcription factor [Telluribacter sp. SYSU D00476]
MEIPSRIRVLIADDHVMFNDGLALQLTLKDSSLEVISQVYRGEDVLPAVQRFSPHIVLLDINLPKLNGIDCARLIIKHSPSVRVIMLTMYAYRKFIKECYALGIAGYLLKNERADTIIDTIHKVMNGHLVYPETHPSNAHEDDFFIKKFKLTPTEIKIIGMIRRGLSSQQIANTLYVSFETIRSHRKNIYRKLSINHVSELIDFANEYGL